ncbi:MAG: UDP-N-acetylenolpyruvoylglucosamine reductase [Bacteroidetes bacterium]|nr:UDP-N-acetylenolpyruvoylglucosamine reductase [Bacteroidota bacterium]
MQILSDIDLKGLNTFHIDASARYFAEVFSVDDILELQNDKLFRENKKLVLGGGSNLLLTKDFDGMVVKVSIPGIVLEREDEHHYYVKVSAGVVWHEFVLYCIAHGYAGVENLSLIPGQTGAAPMQNIGAYGVELKDVCVRVEGVHIETGEVIEFTAADCEFGYRESVFKNRLKNQFVITAVHFRLNKEPRFNVSYGDIKATLDDMKVFDLSIKAISDAVVKIRSSKLPDPAVLGNAGSFFKNPTVSFEKCNELIGKYPLIPHYPQAAGDVKLPAGWLIEQCGWKGKRVGNTGSHAKQALVLVNYGDATGHEVYQLAMNIRQSVMDKFGVEMNPEVNLV